MNILVTGGAGFIGSHLVERLAKEGHHVHVVDSLVSSPLPWDEMFEEMSSPDNVKFYQRTVYEHYSHGQLGNDYELIYHLASPVGPAGILDWAGELAYNMINDMNHVTYLAKIHNCRLVFVSTSEIYGGGVRGLCREDMPSSIQAETTVRLEYAVGKLAAEIAVRNQVARSSGVKYSSLDAVIVRPFNVCGARQSSKGGFVVPRFVQQALDGTPLTVFGTGQAIRAFTNVKDIVDGLIRAAEKGVTGEVYNLGNDNNVTTILSLAKRVLEATGSTAGYQSVDGKDIYGPLYAEAADKYPDATKAMTELGWKPTIDIDSTIQEVVEYEQRQRIKHRA